MGSGYNMGEKTFVGKCSVGGKVFLMVKFS